MARPKKSSVGNQRDGFVNYRIPPETSRDLNTLAFVLETSVGELVRMAINDKIAKHREIIDAINQAKEKAKGVENREGEVV